jgi:GTP-binding protein
MDYLESEFIISAHSLKQLPEDGLPEVAFAGRSNVGKSSLLNALLNRKNLVKVSARPGKTQALNYFLIENEYYVVDLPGYGYARVSKNLKADWAKLITSYLETRKVLRCVVVIMDLRHEAKELDSELLQLLRQLNLPFVAVYTKADKLSGNALSKNARRLDEKHGLAVDERVIFSAKNKRGRDQLMGKLLSYVEMA